MARDDLPIVPHEVTGADFCGCLIAKVHGDQATILCNECGAVIRTVHVDDTELPLSKSPGHLWCGTSALRVHEHISGLKVIEAFICGHCGHCGKCVGDHGPVRQWVRS